MKTIFKIATGLALVNLTVSQISFQDQTINYGVGFNGSTNGVNFIDYNNDGWDDIYLLLESGEENRLYKNPGNGDPFENEASTANVNHPGFSYAGTFADYNNDGYIDIFMTTHGANPNVLYFNEGTSPLTFIDIIGDPSYGGFYIEGGGDDAGCLWLDYDLDGDLDVFLVDHHGQGGGYFLYENNSGIFSNVSSTTLFQYVTPGRPPLEPAEGAGQCVVAADFDNDGDVDIYTTSSESGYYGSSFFINDLLNSRLIKYTDEDYAGNLTQFGEGIAVGDFDNDGFLDLIIGNIISGGSESENNYYHNDGDGTFTKMLNSGIESSESTRCVQTGDYDNDGYLDIYFANTNGPNQLFKNNGDNTFTDITSGSNTGDTGNGSVCANGDFNNDGLLDIYLGNSNGNTKLFENTTINSNNFLKIELEGTITNKSAINSRIEVTTTSPTLNMIREIFSTMGRFSQNSLTAHFGLNTSVTADVTIKWLSGIIEYIDDVDANQKIKIIEGDPEAPSNLIVSNEGMEGQNPILQWDDTDESIKGYDIYRKICTGFKFSNCSGWVLMNSAPIQENYWVDTEYAIDEGGPLQANYKVKVTDLTNKVSPFSNVASIEVCCSGMFRNDDGQNNTKTIGYKLNCYPNPFNPVTSIEVFLPDKGKLDLSIYNLNGRQIENIAFGEYNDGAYSFQWDARSYPSGIYFVKLTVGDVTETKRLLLLK